MGFEKDGSFCGRTLPGVFLSLTPNLGVISHALQIHFFCFVSFLNLGLFKVSCYLNVIIFYLSVLSAAAEMWLE